MQRHKDGRGWHHVVTSKKEANEYANLRMPGTGGHYHRAYAATTL